jgi:hypothetical protein
VLWEGGVGLGDIPAAASTLEGHAMGLSWPPIPSGDFRPTDLHLLLAATPLMKIPSMMAVLAESWVFQRA